MTAPNLNRTVGPISEYIICSIGVSFERVLGTICATTDANVGYDEDPDLVGSH